MVERVDYPSEQLKLGDFVLFKGQGLTFSILSFFLCFFDKSWRKRDWKPWHVGFVAEILKYDDWVFICEATEVGVHCTPLNLIENDIRFYRWLDTEPHSYQVSQFIIKHLGQGYDVAIYFHTAVQYLLLQFIEWFQNTFIPWKKFSISLPRILDNRWSCWELLFWFARAMGKPIEEHLGYNASRYPMITDLYKALEK